MKKQGNPPETKKHRGKEKELEIKSESFSEYSQDFHFLLQDPWTPEGFQKGFRRGLRRGL